MVDSPIPKWVVEFCLKDLAYCIETFLLLLFAVSFGRSVKNSWG